MPRPRGFDEEEVLAAACNRFWDNGYAATSLDDLMSATGLGKGSLYGAFGDKHQLFLRALDDYRERLLCGIRSTLLEGTGSPWRRLKAFVMAIAEGASTEQGLRGCLLANSSAELNSRDPEVLARSRSTFAALEDVLAQCLEMARDRGEIAAGVDPREQARLLLAVVEGIRFLGQTGIGRAATRQIARSALDAVPKG
ncbi:TetR/AcrR family transcriptional regulator [Kutzneria albida]|uniref:HTH tetR-type domain-containing protein n=1 Tax=Kutzneria albida DSM 43870 TaxID=1449976 RepID=W5W2V0_9PSEU|nr:TetR/AcrR family transcriptional regulator [Kutzneria albida]AHH95523.1 hypothetical protein KALB_2154 [Kutzneria albida DSM 43870]